MNVKGTGSSEERAQQVNATAEVNLRGEVDALGKDVMTSTRFRKSSYIRSYIAPKEKRFTTIFIAMNPYLYGAGEMNRTPDLLITNDGIDVFAPVD